VGWGAWGVNARVAEEAQPALLARKGLVPQKRKLATLAGRVASRGHELRAHVRPRRPLVQPDAVAHGPGDLSDAPAAQTVRAGASASGAAPLAAARTVSRPWP
jgi:hypothetical protein